MFQPKQAFEDMARGNASAFDFLAAFYRFVHKQDDLIDRDKPVTPEESVSMDLQMLDTFAKNEFFRQHRDTLWPVIVLSGISYVASEDFNKKPEVIDKITAQVLKSEYINVFLAVALCIGGYSHAFEMSRKYRDYSFDYELV